MSTSTLTGLRDYLYDTLSPANMLWLSTQLADYAKKKEEAPLKRYTKAELNALLDEAETNIASGNTIPGEEVWRELEEEFAREDAEEDARYAASYIEELQRKDVFTDRHELRRARGYEGTARMTGGKTYGAETCRLRVYF